VPLSDIIKSHRTKERAQTTEGGQRNKQVAGIDVDNLHKNSDTKNIECKKMINIASPLNHNQTLNSNFDKSTSLNEGSEAKVDNLDD